MLRIAILIITGIAATIVLTIAGYASVQAKQATIQQNIYPLVCDIDIVYDGVNEAYLLTPDDCDDPPIVVTPEIPNIQPSETIPGPLLGLTKIENIDGITLPVEILAPPPSSSQPNLINGTDATVVRTDPSPANVTTAAVAVGAFLVVQVAAIQLGLFEPVGRVFSRLHLLDLFKK